MCFEKSRAVYKGTTGNTCLVWVMLSAIHIFLRITIFKTVVVWKTGGYEAPLYDFSDICKYPVWKYEFNQDTKVNMIEINKIIFI